MHCSPLRCPYSNSEQRAQLCGAAGPEGSQQHGCSGTVTTRGTATAPRRLGCVPLPCALSLGLPKPLTAPEHRTTTHALRTDRQAGRHTRGARRLRVPLLRLPRLSRPQQTQDGAAQSRPSPRPHSSAATGQQRPGQRGERGRQLPLTSPGPGWAGPTTGPRWARRRTTEPRAPRPAPSRRTGGADGDNDRGSPGSPCPRHRPRPLAGPYQAPSRPRRRHRPSTHRLRRRSRRSSGRRRSAPSRCPASRRGGSRRPRRPRLLRTGAAERKGGRGAARKGRGGGAGRGRLRHRPLTAPPTPGPLARSPAVLHGVGPGQLGLGRGTGRGALALSGC